MSKLATIFLISFSIISTSFSLPANNEQLDKATINDFAINSITEEKKPDQHITSTTNHHQNTLLSDLSGHQQPIVPSTVEISGISTGINSVPSNPVAPDNGGYKPPKAGSMFARFIDDIFQIPITVLQNVAKLITGPFIQSKKE